MSLALTSIANLRRFHTYTDPVEQRAFEIWADFARHTPRKPIYRGRERIGEETVEQAFHRRWQENVAEKVREQFREEARRTMR